VSEVKDQLQEKVRIYVVFPYRAIKLEKIIKMVFMGLLIEIRISLLKLSRVSALV